MHQQSTLSPDRIATLRILAIALIAGVVVLTAVALLIGPAGSTPKSTLDVLRLLCGGVAVFGFAASLGMKQAIVKQAAARPQAVNDDSAGLFQVFMTATIIALALAEGPAILGAIIVMLSGEPLDALLVLLPLVLMVWSFPTRDRWESFQRTVEQHRAMNR